MGRKDQEVLAYMAASDGVITRAEALALGMPPTTLTEWARIGHIRRVGHGIYVLPGVLDSHRSLLGAATRALNAVVSHESSAILHGIDHVDPRQIVVTVPVRRSNRFEGVVVHQSTDLASDETTVIDGLPVTDPTRTIIDLAAVLRSGRLAMLLDQAVRMDLATYASVSDRLEATARRGKPGVKRLRSVLASRLGKNFASESTLETKMLNLLESAGLPRPSTQFRPDWLRSVNGRVDLAYLDERIVIECDSRRFHGSPESFQLDRRRDNLAALAGWLPLRFTWEDLTKRPAYVLGTVREALMKRRKDGIPSVEH